MGTNPTMRPRSLYDEAMEAVSAGISIVPPLEDGSKAPITAWKLFQTNIAPPGRIRRWYETKGHTGIGAVCGIVSGKLECLEHDGAYAYKLFRDTTEAAGLGDLLDRIEAGYLDATPSGGRHALYRCTEIAGNLKLARDEQGKALIETRGEGGYVICAPSYGAVHASGAPYVRLSGSFATIVTITPDERAELHGLARALDQMPDELPLPPIGSTRSPDGKERPGDLFNAQASWGDVLNAHGWTHVGNHGEEGFWRRPGKDRGVSATTNYKGSDVLKVFTSSTPFEQGRTFTKFGAYAVLEHGGDFKAATKDLAARGYSAAVHDNVKPSTFTMNGGSQNGASDEETKREVKPESPLDWSDEGNAQRLISRHGDDLRYVSEHASWYIWAGDRWAKDEREKVVALAREIPTDIFAEAATATSEQRATDLVKFAVKSLNVNRILAMPRLMRTDTKVAIAAADLDADPMLLNTPTGTIDCQSGELRPHDRAHLLTKITGAADDPNAQCPKWLDYLDLVFNGDADVIRFVQKLCGYTLTGSTSEQVFMIMHGPQGTGKTTFMNTLFGVMGGYAVNADASTFMVKQRSGRATPEIARLQGARLISTSETEQGERLAAALVKRFSGNTRITASHLYAPDFEFTPVGKIWIDTNHKPQIPQGDDAVWARLILLPFMVQIRGTKRDRKGFADELKSEWPGILRWMVEGCLAWQMEGLKRPAAVSEATNAYHEESDVLGAFIAERCETGPGLRSPATPIYLAWVDWAKAKNEKVIAYKEFRQQMIERGHQHKAINVGSVYIGIALRETDPDDRQTDFTDVS